MTTAKKKVATKKTCSICLGPVRGFGNNARPLNSGRCCDECNNVVVWVRIKRFGNKQKNA